MESQPMREIIGGRLIQLMKGDKMINHYEVLILMTNNEYYEKKTIPLIMNGRRVIPENTEYLSFRSPSYPDKLIYGDMNAIPTTVKRISVSAKWVQHITTCTNYFKNGIHIIPNNVKTYVIDINYKKDDETNELQIIKDGVSFINTGAKSVDITVQFINHPLIVNGVKAFPDTIEKLHIHTDCFYKYKVRKYEESKYFKSLACGFCEETNQSVFPNNLKELSGLGIFNPYKLMKNGISSLPGSLQKLTNISVESFSQDSSLRLTQTYVFLVSKGKRILPDSFRILEITNFFGDMIIDGITVFPDNLQSLKIDYVRCDILCFPEKLETLEIMGSYNFSYFTDETNNGRKILPDSIVNLCIIHTDAKKRDINRLVHNGISGLPKSLQFYKFGGIPCVYHMFFSIDSHSNISFIDENAINKFFNVIPSNLTQCQHVSYYVERAELIDNQKEYIPIIRTIANILPQPIAEEILLQFVYSKK